MRVFEAVEERKSVALPSQVLKAAENFYSIRSV